MDVSLFTSEIVVLSLLAALLAVDDRAGWQSLVSEPVFAGLIVGALASEPAAGLLTGVSLQLVWLAILPMRGAKRPDIAVGTVVGAGAACLLLRHTGDPRDALMVGCGVVVGLLVGEFAGLIVEGTGRLRARWLAGVELSERRAPAQVKLSLVHMGAVVSHAVVGAAVCAVTLPFALLAVEWFTRVVGDGPVGGITAWLELLPVFGAAAIALHYWQKDLNRFVLLSAGVILVILWIR